MTWIKFFSGAIRIVFLFAFASFLWASIHHVAAFFHNFEPGGSDYIGSYALAISVDATALVLTLGIMFFNSQMPTYAKIIVWFFIFCLTGFSWIVNWQYAQTYQGSALVVSPFWHDVNPILASSFAFLNLAYSIVAEFFTFKVKTVEELQKELDEINGRESLVKQLAEKKKGKSLIQKAKETALEINQAASEIVTAVSDKKLSAPPAKNLQENLPTIEKKTDEILAEITQETFDKIESARNFYDKIIEPEPIILSEETSEKVLIFPIQNIPTTPELFESFSDESRQKTDETMKVSDIRKAIETAEKNLQEENSYTGSVSQNSIHETSKSESVFLKNMERGFTPEQLEKDERIIAIFPTPAKRKIAIKKAIESKEIIVKSDGKIREHALKSWLKNLTLVTN